MLGVEFGRLLQYYFENLIKKSGKFQSLKTSIFDLPVFFFIGLRDFCYIYEYILRYSEFALLSCGVRNNGRQKHNFSLL